MFLAMDTLIRFRLAGELHNCLNNILNIMIKEKRMQSSSHRGMDEKRSHERRATQHYETGRPNK